MDKETNAGVGTAIRDLQLRVAARGKQLEAIARGQNKQRELVEDLLRVFSQVSRERTLHRVLAQYIEERVD